MKLTKKVSNKLTFPIIKSNWKLDKEFKVLFIGDVSFAENYILEYEKRPNIGVNIIEHFGYDYFFEKTKRILFDAELVIANLETPLVDIKHTPRPFFSFSTRYNKKQGRFQHWSDHKITPTYLKKYNITNVSLANNHMLDYGIDGLYQTLESLDKHRINFFGAGYNRKQARTPFIRDIVVGNQILKLVIFSAFEYREGYDKDFSFYASKSIGGVNRLSFTAITQKIKKLREEIENIFVVVFPHWGGPRDYGGHTKRQIKMGHKLIDAGANLIIGHGPHNLQQIEKYKEHWIIYSLGNFLDNSYGNFDKYNALPYGLAANLIFSENLNKKTDNSTQSFSDMAIKKYLKLYPIVIDNQLTKFQARFVNVKEFKFISQFLNNNKELLLSYKDERKYGTDSIGRFIELPVE
jgi:hypothetical protein